MSKSDNIKPVLEPKKAATKKDLGDADLDKVSGGHGKPTPVGGPGTYPTPDQKGGQD